MDKDNKSQEFSLESFRCPSKLSYGGIGKRILESLEKYSKGSTFTMEILPNFEFCEQSDPKGINFEIGTSLQGKRYPLIKLYTCDSIKEYIATTSAHDEEFVCPKLRPATKFETDSFDPIFSTMISKLNQFTKQKEYFQSECREMKLVAVNSELLEVLRNETNEMYELKEIFDLSEEKQPKFYMHVYTLAEAKFGQLFAPRKFVAPAHKFESASTLSTYITGPLGSLFGRLYSGSSATKTNTPVAVKETPVTVPLSSSIDEERVRRFEEFRARAAQAAVQQHSFFNVDVREDNYGQVVNQGKKIVCSFESRSKFEKTWTFEEILKFGSPRA